MQQTGCEKCQFKELKEADVDHRSYPMATLPVSDDNVSLLDSALQVAGATMDVIEISLASLFFLVRDENNLAAYRSQGVCMILVLFFTVGYQFLLNEAFERRGQTSR
jgi:hypothetical protein